MDFVFKLVEHVYALLRNALIVVEPASFLTVTQFFNQKSLRLSSLCIRYINVQLCVKTKQLVN